MGISKDGTGFPLGLNRHSLSDVEGFESLVELALDMRWSWNQAADEVWRSLDPNLWDSTHNPWVILETISRDELVKVLGNAECRGRIDALIRARRKAVAGSTWYTQAHPDVPLMRVAYFSMEFMLSESLPIYSGGLGNVAGDQMKAASDLGVPLVGVGLLYQQGYFRQVIDRNGSQLALYPYNDPSQLPVLPVYEANGEWLRIQIPMPGYPVWLRAWQVQVGALKLYLLDSNDAANFPQRRGITSELYGGGSELRLKQEIVLGIGGWRLLQALGLKPDVCHLNEGHAGFVILERARAFMEETGQPFEVALSATRAGNLFTTHTPVEAGFDRFSPALFKQFMGAYAEGALGISIEDLMALGQQNPEDPGDPFNMATLCIRGSGAVNGVSRLHGQVSRRIFVPFFPRWPEPEVPVGYVTNGIHVPSWDSAQSDRFWTDSCGEDRWFEVKENLPERVRSIPDDDLWQLRSHSRRVLVEFVRERLALQLASINAPPGELEAARGVFDPNALTLGFARRFATYKRPNLLLHDPERLLRILTNPDRPVQLLVAGKAHPEDGPGQAMIREWTLFIARAEARQHVVFLGDYDMLLTRYLVQGVDLWLNTPRRPWEASGTSGMKTLVNGGLNLSELDGWWAEAYTPEVGWALGDGHEHGDAPAWDAKEAEALYDLLEREVVPAFYTRDGNGIPADWVARMRESMATLTPRYSATRSVREYTDRYYVPAARAYRERSSNGGRPAAEIVEWLHRVRTKWPGVRFRETTIKKGGEGLEVEAQVYLNGLNPEEVRLELYAEPWDDAGPERHELAVIRGQGGAEGSVVYGGSVRTDRAVGDYTARLIPFRPGAVIPLELTEILWQR